MGRQNLLPHLLASRAEATPDRVFLVEVDGRSATFAELHSEALRWADAYRRAGVGAADRVAVMLPSSIEAVCAWLGLCWLGALEVPVNTAYVGRMLAHILGDSGSRMLVTTPDALYRLEAIADHLCFLERVVVVGGDSCEGEFAARLPFDVTGLEDFLDGARPALDLRGPEPSDISTVMYTSGTTGASKGVLVPFAQLLATASASIFVGDFGPDDAYYMPFPLFHISGKGPIQTFLLVGGRVVMRPSFNTDRFWTDIKRHGCTTTLLLGAMANFIYRRPQRPDDAATPLHTVVMVPLVRELEDFRRRFGVRVSTAFNMTEISVPIHSEGWYLPNLESCGKVRPGYEVRVVNENDEALPPGSVGELIVRSREPWSLMAGYFNRPEATLEAWRNLWLHTGDAFRYDTEGNYYFVDRVKDTIRRRGENISSMEVEAEVNEHPGVLESAAVAVASEWGEDEVMIVVVPREGRVVEPDSLIEFLADRMPKFMVPRFVRLAGSLPKTPTGKVRKVELRAEGVTPSTWDGEAKRQAGERASR